MKSKPSFDNLSSLEQGIQNKLFFVHQKSLIPLFLDTITIVNFIPVHTNSNDYCEEKNPVL